MANFQLVVNKNGRHAVQGVIDKKRLTNYEKTLLIRRPNNSFYQHYQRP